MAQKIVVIGGVAAGPKAAARARRVDPDAEITIIEREEILSYAGCGLPYWISGVVKERKDLLATPVGALRDPEFFGRSKNIRALNRTEALEIDRGAKIVRCKRLETGELLEIPYDKLILATGSRPIELRIKGSNLRNVMQLKDPEDASRLREAFSEACHRVTIVGGGLIGCEMTEAVRECGKHVTIVEMKPHLLPGLLDEGIALLLEKELRDQGVTILTNTRVDRFEGDGKNNVKKVITSDGEEIPTQFVLMAIGVKPVVDLAQKAGLALGERGGIKVNSHMQTSDPDIYAAGDCVEHLAPFICRPMVWPMGSIANKEGRVAGTNAAGGEETFKGIVGTNALKVFSYNVGHTGLTSADARAMGFKITTGVIAGPDRAHYYPGSQPIVLKAIVETKTRRLLGVQGIGRGDIAKRIDVAATAIGAGLTIDHLADLDLAYAPPYAPAMDPLITLANVVQNKLDDMFEGISALEVKRKRDANHGFFFLDVRTKEEFEAMRIPGSTLIPVGELRDRIAEVPRDSEVIVFCAIGLRGYEGARILRGEGFEKVKVMEGGIAAWPFETEAAA